MKNRLPFLLVLFSIGCFWGVAQGEDEKKPAPNLAPSLTQHSLNIEGKSLEYQAETGLLALKKIAGLPDASFFYVYYSCSGNSVSESVTSLGKDEKSSTTNAPAQLSPKNNRPIIFSFNGGPGSSSVWLHLGFLGPQRVVLSESGLALPPPADLAANPTTALSYADLVFIDPITTGFSRAEDPQKAGEFHNFNSDIKSVSEFIRLFLTKKQKWGCPKFVIGESYGTIRAVGVADYLQKEHGLALNGLILVSSVLNFQALHTAPGSDLSTLLYLPSLSASAWFHGALPPEYQKLELPELLNQAEKFSSTQYAQSLFAGSALESREKEELNRKLAQFTGLSSDLIANCEQRIPMSLFTKKILANKNQVCGRMDSRVLGDSMDPVSPNMEYDPCLSSLISVFSGAMNQYLQRDLAYLSDEPYEILTGKVHPWRWGAENQYLNVCDKLSNTMIQNPYMQVMVVSGIYDLATPYYATEYNLRHLELPQKLRANISSKTYPAGHMPFLDNAVLKNLSADVKEFVLGACRGKVPLD
jgi:carboxypeptidase C (cathepsin A)